MTAPDHRPYLADTDLRTAEDVAGWLRERADRYLRANCHPSPLIRPEQPFVDEGNALTVDWETPRLVVMNPPFGLAQEFAERALAEVALGGTVAALLRLAFLKSTKRAGFHRSHPADVFVLSKRPSFTGGGTDSAAYAWFVWEPGRGGRWSVLGGEVAP